MVMIALITNKLNESVRIIANAKINLILEVLFKREDNYHELRSIMHSIGIYDVITMEKNYSNMINVTCSSYLPENNTALKAAKLFRGRTNCCGVNIHIEKGIPFEAGMGGASADAAAVLRGMKHLFSSNIDEETLFSIGKSVGADVPFCLVGGCALAEGIGEKLTKLNSPIPELNLLVVKGYRGISTGKLFASLNMPSAADANLSAHTSTIQLANSLNSHCDAKEIAKMLNNELMTPAVNLAPEIAEYRNRMLNSGALGACMTGSGSAVFGIFSSATEAELAADGFADCEFVKVCKTKRHGVEIEE